MRINFLKFYLSSSLSKSARDLGPSSRTAMKSVLLEIHGELQPSLLTKAVISLVEQWHHSTQRRSRRRLKRKLLNSRLEVQLRRDQSVTVVSSNMAVLGVSSHNSRAPVDFSAYVLCYNDLSGLASFVFRRVWRSLAAISRAIARLVKVGKAIPLS